MSLKLITPPAFEPVTLEEARLHSHAIGGVVDQDALTVGRIISARRWVETHTARALVTQTWDWSIDRFAGVLKPPIAPLQSVTSITYTDTAGNPIALAATEFTVDDDPDGARLVPAFGKSWPSTLGHINDVTVRFVAGYATLADIPRELRSAMLLIVSELSERREEAIVGAPITAVVLSAERLVFPYRVRSF